jgi:hypothetical protein
MRPRNHPLSHPNTAGLVNLVTLVLGATLASGFLPVAWRLSH